VTHQVDVLWIPLGAGQVVVRASGKLFERLWAAGQRRQPSDLYHSALVFAMPEHLDGERAFSPRQRRIDRSRLTIQTPRASTIAPPARSPNDVVLPLTGSVGRVTTVGRTAGNTDSGETSIVVDVVASVVATTSVGVEASTVVVGSTTSVVIGTIVIDAGATVVVVVGRVVAVVGRVVAVESGGVHQYEAGPVPAFKGQLSPGGSVRGPTSAEADAANGTRPMNIAMPVTTSRFKHLFIRAPERCRFACTRTT
jgi:hypothetical protein